MTQESSNSPPGAEPARPAKPPTNQHRLQVLLRMLSQLGGIVRALVPVILNLLRQLWQLTLAFLRWLQQQWAVLLPKIRTVLPASWQTRLPDQVITAVAIGLLVLLLWIPIALRSDQSPAVAKGSKPGQTNRRTAPASPVESVPDPNRIAAIQEQLSEVTAEYAEGLIQAVEANFLRSRLTVNVSDEWYTLDAAQRDQLANELLKRSKKLDFDTLEIADLEGILLARSPVVGATMVLLVGSQSAG